MINFIQIGANIGNTPQDIIWPIVRERGWNGIFVEPHPEAFEELKVNYNDLSGSYFENCAICGNDGYTKLYYGLDTQISSMNKNHSMGANNASKLFNEVEVPCMTLYSLVEKYNMIGKPFELLQIDAEGMDGEILKSTDFTNILPKYIRFEHIHLNYNVTISRVDAVRQDLRKVLNYLECFGYVKIKDMYNSGQEFEEDIDTMVERI